MHFHETKLPQPGNSVFIVWVSRSVTLRRVSAGFELVRGAFASSKTEHTIIEAISLERFRERRARGQTGAEAGNHHHYRAILFRLWYIRLQYSN